MHGVIRITARGLLVFLALYLAPVAGMWIAHQQADTNVRWSALRRDSSQQAADPVAGEAVIQVYAARAARWRGVFGVHTWVATRRSHETHWQRMEVIGYGVMRWGEDAVRVRRGNPDGYWYGNRPTLLRDLRGGAKVDAMIERLEQAAENYPYRDVYRVWPGPNSNTFVAWLARQLPELQLELPALAIGKDYLPGGAWMARTPSGLGGQLSARGYVGLMASLEEGVEVNLLGLSAGIDLWPPAIKLPGIGRIGFEDQRHIKF